MSMPLSLQIALRFSRGRRHCGIVSLISVISTISITLGVSVLIIALSAINGFERELNNRILAVVPHGEIEPVDPPFADWKMVIKRVEQVPGILAAAPYLNFTGLVERDDKLQTIRVKGVDSIQESRLSALPRYVHGDDWQRFQSGKQKIIIGKGVADTLQVKQGDWLTVIIPNSDPQIQMKLLQPKRIHLQIDGILALNGQLDRNFAMVPLEDAQQYLQRSQDIDGIAVKVGDVFNANKLMRHAGEATNTHVKIRSWISSYGYMYRDVQTIRAIVYLAMVLVIGVACFNIVSTLMVAVKNKSADIAILRTLGMQDRLTRAIFIWYGLLTGLSGSLIGVATGMLIAPNLTIMVKGLEHLLGHRLLSRDIYFIDFLPTELRWVNIISVLITTLLLSLLASWYPAWRASLIAPSRVLSIQ
ncbi:MAG: lipoprotein release complex - inner membrane subunit [Sodalis sp. Psp]|nr:lipoprotein release complex - inner membrane subunit [Sodalis sp. Psp]MCR3756558.1 lipoprotein release complex - inner membrane subunit [Sodalis sp. Ppy]